MLNKIRRYHLSDGKHAEQSKSLIHMGNENAIIMGEEEKTLEIDAWRHLKRYNSQTDSYVLWRCFPALLYSIWKHRKFEE